MGYKRAGFEVVGNCEIDPRINSVYRENNHPKYSYTLDAREFLDLCRKGDVPSDLFNLDILDGSPPCSTFSMAGLREAAWGKEKKFAEGQKLQRLDDLFFTYLDIVEALRPKVCIAENVTGLVRGNARGYVSEIVARFKELGYSVQIFKLNAAFMNVPQRRERIFFIANNQGYAPLRLNFQGRPITFGEVRGKKPGEKPSDRFARLVKDAKPDEQSLAGASLRVFSKPAYFTHGVLWDHLTPPTIIAGSSFFRRCDLSKVTIEDLRNIGTFPQDYDFMTDTATCVQFLVGMSVPPNMIANIAVQIWEQWLKEGKLNALDHA